tara:strand:+ start:4174 stop:4734 length:561 start_codon:yes stop_codon:yes gene_type:complete
LKRTFDLILSIILILLLAIPMAIISILIKSNSKGPALYWSNRFGCNNLIFKMPKFRSMKQNTASIASHLMDDPDQFTTSFGKFIRKTSLDELPQLYSVVKGDMSLVGPRPALFNQDDLMTLRLKKGVDILIPGITGWAQVNGRDELSLDLKVKFEVEYLNKKSFWFDIKILWMTFIKVFHGKDVSH